MQVPRDASKKFRAVTEPETLSIIGTNRMAELSSIKIRHLRSFRHCFHGSVKFPMLLSYIGGSLLLAISVVGCEKLSFAGCKGAPSPKTNTSEKPLNRGSAGISASEQSPETQQEWQNLVDPERFKKVPVVLRVRLVKHEGGDKYAWDTVKLLAVLKNESKFHFSAEFQIAYYSGEPGVPDGDSTIYLERYQDIGDTLWKLLNGSGKQGVSHSRKSSL